MKKLISMIAFCALCTAATAQENVSEEKMIPTNQFYNITGETRYNVPTNGNARNTIGYKPKATVGAAVWTIGTNSSNRGTGINYHNVNNNSWGIPPDMATGRIETVATGWGTHAFTTEGEIVVAHNGTTGLIVNTRDIAEQGSWQQAMLLGPEYLLNGVSTTAILWPTMATSGNTVHVVCVTDQWPSGTPFPPNYEPNPSQPPHGYLGFPTLPLYYRSTDGGKTWEAPRDFISYGMSNFECFRTSGDNYVLAARGNHVVLLYNDKIGFVNYMESKDGGDTWVKKTVYDFGLEFDQSANADRRLVPTTSSVFIDENHKVHVAFGTQCYFKSGGVLQYHSNVPIGMVYWNDEKPPIDWHDLRGWVSGGYLNYNWDEYPGYIELPSVLGFDKFYNSMDNPDYNPNQFRNSGWAIYPRILAKDGRVYVAYQSPLEYPLCYDNLAEPRNFYQGIFITVSEDDGETWDTPNNTSWISYNSNTFHCDWSNYSGPLYDNQGNPYWDGNVWINWRTENAYPSMSYNYKGNLFMLQWYNQYEPFTQPSGYSIEPIDVFTFTQDLRNIPAYKNIQDIWKGLWDGNDTPIEFPPSSCEKPLEFEGSFDGKDVLLAWEEPDYYAVPLLGYNIFRNGNKLNESPITETNYVDKDLEDGTYYYQISAVYEDCESELTCSVTIVTQLFCEKPTGLSGTAEENTAIITWHEPEEINDVLVGYNVYRDAVKLNEAPITVQEYRDEELEDGTYIYQVSAVYEHCEESELTDGVSVTIITDAIDDYPSAHFDISPNPTTGEITITNYELRITDVEIYDVYGKNVSSHHLIPSSSNHLINISHLPAGVYIVKVDGVCCKVVKR